MIFSGERPKNIGVQNGTLTACPDKPNCVCSLESRRSQRIEPLSAGPSSSLSMENIKAAVNNLPGVTIITSKNNYLHAECKTKILGFVDDLEVMWDEKNDVFQVRSASRLGYSDLGVNRKRVEKLRNLLSNS